MTQLKLSKIGKVVVAVTYIALIVFLAWPTHMDNPLNWLKIVLIMALLAYKSWLKAVSTWDDSFISTDVDCEYFWHYIISFIAVVSTGIGLVKAITISGTDIVTFTGLAYLIVVTCLGTLFLLGDIVAIVSISWANFDRWLIEVNGLSNVILKLPLVNILFEQPSKKVKIDEDESTKKVKM